MRELLVTVGVVVALGGCGSGDEVSTDRGRPTLVGTFETLAAAGDGQGSAVVVSGTVDGAAVTTVWTEDTEGRIRSSRVPSEAPLYDVTTWTDDDTVAVLGVECPPWASGEPPSWDDESDDNAVASCGSTQYGLWLLDRTTGEWVPEVSPPELRSADGYAFVGQSGSMALLRRQGDDGPALVAVNGRDGVVGVLPDPVGIDGLAEASFQPCVDAVGQGYALAQWEAEVPASFEEQGWGGVAAGPARRRWGFGAGAGRRG